MRIEKTCHFQVAKTGEKLSKKVGLSVKKGDASTNSTSRFTLELHIQNLHTFEQNGHEKPRDGGTAEILTSTWTVSPK